MAAFLGGGETARARSARPTKYSNAGRARKRFSGSDDDAMPALWDGVRMRPDRGGGKLLVLRRTARFTAATGFRRLPVPGLPWQRDGQDDRRDTGVRRSGSRPIIRQRS